MAAYVQACADVQGLLTLFRDLCLECPPWLLCTICSGQTSSAPNITRTPLPRLALFLLVCTVLKFRHPCNHRALQGKSGTIKHMNQQITQTAPPLSELPFMVVVREPESRRRTAHQPAVTPLGNPTAPTLPLPSLMSCIPLGKRIKLLKALA